MFANMTDDSVDFMQGDTWCSGEKDGRKDSHDLEHLAAQPVVLLVQRQSEDQAARGSVQQGPARELTFQHHLDQPVARRYVKCGS